MAKISRQARFFVRNAAKDFGLGWLIPRAYAQACVQPVDPRKVVFIETSRESLPEAFKVMFARLEADPGFDVRFISLGKHRVSATRYLANCERAMREVATARLVFLCDASDVISSVKLRPDTTVVQLWHGCGAFKRFGLSTVGLSYGLSREEVARHPFHENLSLVTVSSPEVRWAYVEAMGLEGREDIVQATGVSRTDVFFSEGFYTESLKLVYDAVPAAIGKRVVLYAPTFRGKLAHAKAPACPDFAQMCAALGEDAVVLVKQHPMVLEAPPIPGACVDRVFDVTRELPIDELMVVADVLVTDYSSIIFEYALFGRPMLFFAPDLGDFVGERSFYYDYEQMTPGPVAFDSGELAARLASIDEWFDPWVIARFCAKFMSACDGHATERILQLALDTNELRSPRRA